MIIDGNVKIVPQILINKKKGCMQARELLRDQKGRISRLKWPTQRVRSLSRSFEMKLSVECSFVRNESIQ
jgi:hypothetical protein